MKNEVYINNLRSIHNMKRTGVLKFSLSIMFRVAMFSIMALVLIGALLLPGGGDIWLWVAEFCIIVFVIGFIYPYAWNEGFRDVNRVKIKSVDKLPGKGFIGGAIGSLPYMLISLGFILVKLEAVNINFLGIIRLLAAPFLAFSLTLLPVDIQTAAELSWINIIVVVLLPLFYVLLSGIGYELGYKRFSISDKLIYKSPNRR